MASVYQIKVSADLGSYLEVLGGNQHPVSFRLLEEFGSMRL